MNTALNYVLIFGKLGFPAMGAAGAAVVSLGLLSAFVWRLPAPQVYFLLSLEEVVRLCLSAAVFRRRKWIHRLESAGP